MIRWLLEHGGAQIADTDSRGMSVWTAQGPNGLQNLLKIAYA
jgi:hypothetical protein